MKNIIRFILVSIAALFISIVASAQSTNTVTANLKDSNTDEAVSFATVSLTLKGAKKPSYYVLSSENGAVKIQGVNKGTYTMRIELLGYKTYEKEVKVEGSVDMSTIKVSPDAQVLNAASVSAVGNPIQMKRDTIEFSASTYKTTENDALEDLLKKIPGIEVEDDGTVKFNGDEIKKITIDGKTFFLDDPQLATKNIPAKIVEKLKVIEKKSDQAEFTGIDDGEEEHIIDLSVKKGMMKGLFGNVRGGFGHDIPAQTAGTNDYRYEGAGFAGRFNENSQISLVLNANNTNNRGFNDLSGNMMGQMRGNGNGGNGSGITKSLMTGLNGAWTLLDNRMNLGGNYVYNNTQRNVANETKLITHLADYDLDKNTIGNSWNKSQGHRFGVRMEHKFSDNTSIIFQPSVNFGTGRYQDESMDTTYKVLNDQRNLLNESLKINAGNNKNVNASGFFLFRQRLGIPGRTLTASARFSFSNNQSRGINRSLTSSYDTGEAVDSVINQVFDSKRQSVSVSGNVTYTEPLGGNFYIEGNYSYSWSRSTSSKDAYDAELSYDQTNYETFNVAGRSKNVEFSNSIINEAINQSAGVNMLFQKEKTRFQIGVSLKPTRTINATEKRGVKLNYDSKVLNWAPQAMGFVEINENSNLRFFYNGRSNQPSTNQLMPVPDVSDPLNVSFGNPSLKPYFAHSLRGDYRFNNKKTFSSLNVRINGNYTKDPIVNAMWYGKNGAQYKMPFNGDSNGSAGANVMGNFPIKNTNFTISGMASFNWSLSNSFVSTTIDMSKYQSGGVINYEQFIKDVEDGVIKFDKNVTQNISAMGRLRVRYRLDNLEIGVSGRTRYGHTWYSIANRQTTNTFNNQVGASLNWTWDAPGITFKPEFNYNWYNGYTTAQKPVAQLNAEIQKFLFKKKVTLAIKGYDILGQTRALNVTDSDNYHKETVNNTLGRYLILSLTYRFGTFNGNRGRMGGPGMGGPGMGGPGMGGGR